MAEAQSPGSRSTSPTSVPWCDLNQMRSWSTMLIMEMGALNRRAAMEVMRSNEPSGGVSRMS
jgi:hypothetical protein